MKYVEIIASAGSKNTISAIAKKVKALDFRVGVLGEDGMQQMRMLVDDNNLQETLDTLQTVLGAQPTIRIVVLPVYADLPKKKDEPKDEKVSSSIIRESLYQEVARGARLDSNYILLVILATTVAAIGLIENNVAVVIGAMVIAPLLGPNLALSLGTALGDGKLMLNSIKTLFIGILIAIGMSVVIGLLWPGQFHNHEIMSRTNASLDSIALALASGAAATLSLTTGLSGVLVGVMVAVALLPPAVTMGIMLGNGQMHLASGAGLLLAINIVCVNLASKSIFLFKGIRPRTWIEKKKANKAMMRYILGWISTLTALLTFIFFRGSS
ncbi:TIGR00341 family protein [Microbulbifer echini]|uniref:TIGR00341 family protein n=1 Tax=Microbulbifer echini TaxID=1529067 RepID=A0ABV4NNA3_9GAMM|nr:TIGR00341 family protein [uncultured Microbulbifer sp.]